MRKFWPLWFFLTCAAAGGLSTVVTWRVTNVLLYLDRALFYSDRAALYSTGIVAGIGVGISILCGVLTGLLFGVYFYRDIDVLRNARKHMFLYWMYWILCGGAFALISRIFLLGSALLLVILGGIG